MDNYFDLMENYSPNEDIMSNNNIINLSGLPQTTSLSEDEREKDREEENPSYLAPKTIEVKRYRLKK